MNELRRSDNLRKSGKNLSLRRKSLDMAQKVIGRSAEMKALENFWNSWAALCDDVKLIVCGSATFWMIDNLIHSRGGLQRSP